jgi:hypothetical protein
MKTGKPTQEMFRLLLGLAIVAVITVVIISTLHGPAPGSHTVVASSSPTQPPQQTATPPQPPTTVVPYPYPNPYEFLTSTAAVRQTAAGPLDTQWAIMLATYLATTPSPTPIRTFPPTGTREDMYVKPSGEKLRLDAPTLGFVSSLTAIAPSATPSPTSVPYIPPPTSTPVPTFIPYPTPGG